MKVQVAFQGGGAKLVNLLAAAETLQHLEKRGEIEITRVAGASAGAIAATLVAAEKEVRPVLERLYSDRNKVIAALSPPKSLAAKSIALLRLWNGRPIVDDANLRRIIEEYFLAGLKAERGEPTESKELRVGDLKKDLLISRAHLLSRDLEPAGPTILLLDAIVDSCAIPFFFRGYANLPFADGGIADNLPVELLSREGSGLYGEVLAISFRQRDNDPPRNNRQYALSLLETAMNAKQESAKHAVRSRDYVHEIRTSVGTLDFEGAFALMEGDNKQILENQQKAIADWIRRLDPAPFVSTSWLLKELFKVYEKHLKPEGFSLPSKALVVEANCLDSTEEKRDRLTQVIEINATEVEVTVFDVSTLVGGAYVQVRENISVADSRGRFIDFSLLPALGLNEKDLRWLIFFAEPLTRENGPFTIEVDEVERVGGAGMRGLKDPEARRDYIHLLNKPDCPVKADKASLVLVYPNSVNGSVRAETLVNLPSEEAERFSTFTVSIREDATELRGDSLRSFSRRYPPSRWKLAGLEVSDLLPGEWFGAEFLLE